MDKPIVVIKRRKCKSKRAIWQEAEAAALVAAICLHWSGRTGLEVFATIARIHAGGREAIGRSPFCLRATGAALGLNRDVVNNLCAKSETDNEKQGHVRMLGHKGRGQTLPARRRRWVVEDEDGSSHIIER